MRNKYSKQAVTLFYVRFLDTIKLKKFRKSAGFSLIEVMIAIFVIAVGIIGIYALVPRIVSTVFNNRDRFISSQLAREGFELVRNIRDNNVLAMDPWDTDLDGCSVDPYCKIDFDDSDLTSFDINEVLQINASGFYNYESGTDTKFKRRIIITETELDKRLDVSVEILWHTDKSYLLTGRLYNWR